jgi:hypothetical protein
MVNITIEYGDNNSLTKGFPEGTTFGQVLGDPAVKAVLGYGDNIEPVVDGVVQPIGNPVSEGDAVLVQVKANTKQ